MTSFYCNDLNFAKGINKVSIYLSIYLIQSKKTGKDNTFMPYHDIQNLSWYQVSSWRYRYNITILPSPNWNDISVVIFWWIQHCTYCTSACLAPHWWLNVSCIFCTIPQIEYAEADVLPVSALTQQTVNRARRGYLTPLAAWRRQFMGFKRWGGGGACWR